MGLGKFMFALLIIVVIYFAWVTLLWATWNYTIPLLNDAIYPGTPAVKQVAWTTFSVFAFLLMFLAFPITACWRMPQWNMDWYDQWGFVEYDMQPQVVDVVTEQEYVPMTRYVPGQRKTYATTL